MFQADHVIQAVLGVIRRCPQTRRIIDPPGTEMSEDLTRKAALIWHWG